MAASSEKRILVVDDEPDVRNFLFACIEDAGFLVESAVNGVEALEKIKVNTPDLMTLDMVMPRKSGISLMRKLRSNEKWATIPVIVITAHAHDEFGSEDIQALKALPESHRPKYTMEKPVTPEILVKTICEILEVEPDSNQQIIAKQKFGYREDIIDIIKDTDEETLKKISEMLNKK
ncbi:MAG: response regulator [Desulfobacterales bacterium]|jgi:CheY-like chemotaxis protein|nr:response regulator [Desulfobacteraceae bacterium]MBT4362864.1 response regulator [Desulfobacteraceae bacterium]MBT7086720.1 response regulator [Desulfobacterales bacterium]MBT7697724.1 response regulator [Desulfobacterales bacterium]